jgi:hypothetical protein
LQTPSSTVQWVPAGQAALDVQAGPLGGCFERQSSRRSSRAPQPEIPVASIRIPNVIEARACDFDIEVPPEMVMTLRVATPIPSRGNPARTLAKRLLSAALQDTGQAARPSAAAAVSSLPCGCSPASASPPRGGRAQWTRQTWGSEARISTSRAEKNDSRAAKVSGDTSGVANSRKISAWRSSALARAR